MLTAGSASIRPETEGMYSNKVAFSNDGCSAAACFFGYDWMQTGLLFRGLLHISNLALWQCSKSNSLRKNGLHGHNVGGVEAYPCEWTDFEPHTTSLSNRGAWLLDGTGTGTDRSHCVSTTHPSKRKVCGHQQWIRGTAGNIIPGVLSLILKLPRKKSAFWYTPYVI